MYSLMTVPELKRKLRTRNASTTGKKAELIKRLEAYDRNFDFKASPGPSNECNDPKYHCPPGTSFKDINADSQLPPLNRHEIQSYFERFNAHPRGKDMYEASCLLIARYSNEMDNCYVQGQCKAQMKQVTYIVNVKLSKEGNIEQCNCECAAGSGLEAHCKHVHVLLLAVEDMVRTKTIILHRVSTQTIMNFKKPSKIFYKSPIQAQNLPLINKRKRQLNYDPLPTKDIMPNYNDYVCNLAINYGPSSMPILQTIEPANPYGIEWDHSYTNTNPKDIVLERLLLKNVTAQHVHEIEIQTRGQSNSSEWHKLRSCRATASKFYAICHVQTGHKYLIEKIINPKPINIRAITHGKIHESIAISKYEAALGLSVDKCGLFISKDFPFLAATPDGLLGEETVLEVKCPYAARHKLINPVNVPYLQEINGQLTLKKMHPYYAQVQGQLFCTGRKFCNFIIYTFKEMKILFISRDDDYINKMLSELIAFNQTYLEKEVLNKFYYRTYNVIKHNNKNKTH